jgi:hypothetical protein
MYLVPQGVSGNSVGGGTIPVSSLTTVVAPGAVYELSKWVGYTLRHLSFSAWIMKDYPLGAIAITNRLPDSLHPKDLDPQAFWTLLIQPDFLSITRVLVFNFAPGLIWVGPGEKLYVVVYDLMHSDPTLANTAQWALNMLWEPYSKG